ncbi:hypothetical protein SAMN05216205_3118 [Pseudomonas mohnii]|uniref:Sulfotransferase family protein n=1 Tax=Pseudomonas mohnii TaxID=395600 RepID=A0ABY0Y161_9PSED|nr:hypothetical protein [Pseudomonas mohnii]SEC73427.1 hypothetical protein SAMN05216205_3118 [Pseudomonas mohnii]
MISPTFPIPPYPRLGECYRLLARALDTKSSNRQIDRLAREGDFDWQLIPQLREAFIWDPLSKRAGDTFAHFIMAAVETLHDRYVHLVKSIPLDALTRQQSLPTLMIHLYAPYAASCLLAMHKALPSPPMVALLDSQRQVVDVVFDWFESELGIQPKQLGHHVYPDSIGINKNGRQDLQRWRAGTQLPSLNSIALITQKLLRRYPHRTQFIHAGREWLITARMLSYLAGEAEPYGNLRDLMLRAVLSNFPTVDIGKLLSMQNIQAAKQQRPVVESGLLLQATLQRTSNKPPGAMASTRRALDEFRQLLNATAMVESSSYYMEWLEGRWHVLAGQLESAKVHYEHAADLALYRSGPTQKDIIREALLLAAFLGELPLYKRLKHRALAFDHSYFPGWETSVADAHELKLIGSNFELRFPPRGHFVESAGCV